jgi:DNA topoisomerase-1
MHISPKDTMALAQKLYEGGYITYMRTDSKVYSEEFIEKGIEYITENYNKDYINPNMGLIAQSLEREDSSGRTKNDELNTPQAGRAPREEKKKSKKKERRK